jgi:hypothetical protein
MTSRTINNIQPRPATAHNMPVTRRVRFADELCHTSDRGTAQAAWIAHPSKPSKPTIRRQDNTAPHTIDGNVETTKVLVASPGQPAHAAYLVNARLAEQQAQKAMLIARSMQAEIRSHHGRIAQGKVPYLVHGEPAASTAAPASNTSKSLVKSTSSFLDVLKEPEILSVSMAWITDIFAAQQTASKF